MNRLLVKTKKYFYLFITAVSFGVASPVFAQSKILDSLDNAAKVAGYDDGSTTKNLPAVIGLVVRSLLGLLGVVFMVLIIYAGVLWMTAAGNEEQVGKAKKILSNSVIGLVVVIISYFMVEFLFDVIIQVLKKP